MSNLPWDLEDNKDKKSRSIITIIRIGRKEMKKKRQTIVYEIYLLEYKIRKVLTLEGSRVQEFLKNKGGIPLKK